MATMEGRSCCSRPGRQLFPKSAYKLVSVEGALPSWVMECVGNCDVWSEGSRYSLGSDISSKVVLELDFLLGHLKSECIIGFSANCLCWYTQQSDALTICVRSAHAAVGCCVRSGMYKRIVEYRDGPNSCAAVRTWHRLRIELRPEDLEVYLDGANIMSCMLPPGIVPQCGRIGVLSARERPTYYRNFDLLQDGSEAAQGVVSVPFPANAGGLRRMGSWRLSDSGVPTGSTGSAGSVGLGAHVEADDGYSRGSSSAGQHHGMDWASAGVPAGLPPRPRMRPAVHG